MKKIYATLITIGDELLIGQVIDTNSAWMAQQLNTIGVTVKRRIAVGDIYGDIWLALNDAAKESEIILITGGLGPTADDITKPLLCDYFGGMMVVDAGALQNVKDIFTRFNRPMIVRNFKQAEVPDTCTVIQNKRGTAPGMWFEKEGCIFVSMPGVPHEMKGMMDDFVLNAIKKQFTLPHIIHKTLLTANVGESFLADLIEPWEQALPDFIRLAYLPNFGMVRLRLSAVGFEKELLENAVNSEFEKLQALVQDYLVTNNDETMEAVVAGLLESRNKTISLAESCTGGYMAHLITSMPGSSKYFYGSIVSYDNSVKEHLLGVESNMLQQEGAVSEVVVTSMLQGVLTQLKTDYAIAVSGIMGPAGGTQNKPVGLVWIAAGNNEKVVTKQFNFRFDRKRNIELAATNAFNLLRQFILSNA
jgi:nicotinamide-nucleotide amidase